MRVQKLFEIVVEYGAVLEGAFAVEKIVLLCPLQTAGIQPLKVLIIRGRAGIQTADTDQRLLHFGDQLFTALDMGDIFLGQGGVELLVGNRVNLVMEMFHCPV